MDAYNQVSAPQDNIHKPGGKQPVLPNLQQ